MKATEKIRNLQAATKTGTIEANYEICDELNPAFLFSTTWTDLLTKIASGEIDANELAKKELANRGLNNQGKWVGFEAAKKNTNWNKVNGTWMYTPERDEE